MSFATSPPLHFPIDEVNYRLEHIKENFSNIINAAYDIQSRLRITKTLTDGEEKHYLDLSDQYMENFLIELIQSKFSNDFFLCEHLGEILGRNDFRWVIDGIDGSMNFLRDIPLFCVSIGLQYRNTPICGVVIVPPLKDIYFSIWGQGGFKNEERIHVSSILTLDRALLISSFPTSRQSNMREIISEISAFVSTGRSIRRTGSFVLDLCWLSEGKVDGVWEKDIGVFDIAAAGLIVHESGGNYSDFLGAPIQAYPSSVVASNGYIHGQIVEVLKKSRQELNLN
jgi:myo-inositol-1(or 4)-monophosphatase